MEEQVRLIHLNHESLIKYTAMKKRSRQQPSYREENSQAERFSRYGAIEGSF